MSLVLIVVDSLRHDMLGCCGGRAVTPTVDALAARGVLLERAVSSAPWTVPSVSALLSGVYSHRLGLAQWQQPWPHDRASLFRLAAGSGLEVASFVFDPAYLFCQVPEANVQGSSQEPAAVLRWLRDRRGEGFVLLIHYWWTHIPYVSTPMSTLAWREVTDRVLDAMRRGGRAAVEGVQRLYRLAVERFSEEWLPPLLDAVDLERTWVVITSDHGESWGERPEVSALDDVFDLHGDTLYDEVLRVPLILRPPGGRAPRRVPDLVRSVDLLPTLAELLPLAGELPDLDGRSLAPLLRGEVLAPEDAISATTRDLLAAPELPEDPAELWSALALTTPRRKQIWSPATGRRLAFDLEADPGELVDLAPAGGEVLEAGWRRLAEELARARGGADAREHRLRQLGYLD
jgi:arylsulfatase A-like enzyme